MSLVTNVFRRGATYYFRIRVPVHLCEKVGRRELWRSLRTPLAREALQRLALLQNLTEALWRDLERTMDLGECKALVDTWLSAEIKEDAYLRSMFPGEKFVAAVIRREPSWKPDVLVEAYDHDQLARFRHLSEEDRKKELGPDCYLREELTERELAIEAQRKVFAGGQARLASEDDAIAAEHVKDLFRRNGVAVNELSSLFEAATRMMLRAHGDLARVIQDRDALDWREWLDDDPASDLIARLPGPPVDVLKGMQAQRANDTTGGLVTEMSLRQAASQAIPELGRTDEFKPKRIADYNSAVATFIDWWGSDPSLAEITAKRAGDFATALSHYPSNVHKRLPYRDMKSFAERLESAKSAVEGAVLSPGTINTKYLTPLRRIFVWQKDRGLSDPNPFVGITVRKPKRANAKKARRDFSRHEVVRFYSLPLFVGAAGASGGKLYLPGGVMVSDWRFWVPLICMFTGMRLNEACGLAVADIKSDEGVDYFHVRDEIDGQSAKSDAARRMVPIHHLLLEVGFLEFVEARRSLGNERLFEELQPDSDGYLSGSPSKFLNRLLDRIKDQDADSPGKLTWHSSRHTVVSRLRAGNVRQDVSEEIVGHEGSGTHAGYGTSDLHTLKAAIETIVYRDLDLSALRRTT